jgi:2'-5' RNA ligase
MRLFTALTIPDDVAQQLMLLQGGVPGARWQRREQLHLTLRFIGEVDGSDARALEDALAGIDAPAFDLQLHGVGQFGNKQPHALWAAARKNELLEHLQRKVDNAIRRSGSRRMRTNSPRMSPWRGCAIPTWTSCANGWSPTPCSPATYFPLPASVFIPAS